jgi:hypothetical protein
MTKAYQLTAADTNSHNLYALILTSLGVTQLPQRVDRGAVFPPDFVCTVTFTLSLSQAGNSGNGLSVQDVSGNEITSVLPGIPFSLGAGGTQNNISLQALKIQSSAEGVVTDVSIIQN